MNRIRIGFLSRQLALGGAELVTLELARQLSLMREFRVAGFYFQQNGHDPSLISQAKAVAPVYTGVEEFHDHQSDLDVLVACNSADVRFDDPVPTVALAHGSNEWLFERTRQNFRPEDRAVAVSEACKEVFPPGTHVTVVHNGVDLRRLRPKRSVEEVRASWGIHPGEKVIGYLGRLAHEKRPWIVASIARILGPPYRAVCIGPACSDGPAVAPPGVPTPGPVQNIGDVLRAFDVLVNPSLGEGFSGTLCEAWLCRCPTVSTAVGAVPELQAKHGPLCATVPVEASITDFVKATKEALSPSFQRTVVDAYELAQREFTSEAMGQRWRRFLLESWRQIPNWSA